LSQKKPFKSGSEQSNFKGGGEKLEDAGTILHTKRAGGTGGMVVKTPPEKVLQKQNTTIKKGVFKSWGGVKKGGQKKKKGRGVGGEKRNLF